MPNRQTEMTITFTPPENTKPEQKKNQKLNTTTNMRISRLLGKVQIPKTLITKHYKSFNIDEDVMNSQKLQKNCPKTTKISKIGGKKEISSDNQRFFKGVGIHYLKKKNLSPTKGKPLPTLSLSRKSDMFFKILEKL